MHAVCWATLFLHKKQQLLCANQLSLSLKHYFLAESCGRILTYKNDSVKHGMLNIFFNNLEARLSMDSDYEVSIRWFLIHIKYFPFTTENRVVVPYWLLFASLTLKLDVLFSSSDLSRLVSLLVSYSFFCIWKFSAIGTLTISIAFFRMRWHFCINFVIPVVTVIT